ncbi:MAG: hypothetical protein NTY99_01330 [DPANN group archaeon]|nr:hypothetical protein [DPANN group archaeon]
MNNHSREDICVFAAISEILFRGKNERIYLSKEKGKTYFPKTIQQFEWDGTQKIYQATFTGPKDLRKYVAGAKIFRGEYDLLSWFQKNVVCYFALVQPYDMRVVAVCDKIDLKNSEKGILQELLRLYDKDKKITKKYLLSDMTNMDSADSQGTFNNLADDIEKCLEQKLSK